MINIHCDKCSKNDVCYKKSQVEFIDFTSEVAKMFDITCPNASYVDFPDEYFDYLVKEYENEKSNWI